MTLVGLLAVGAGCASEPLGALRVEILSPVGSDPLLAASYVRLSMTPNGDAEVWPIRPGAPIDVGFHVDADGSSQQLVVEGLDEELNVLARGTSPPVDLEPGVDLVFRVVTRPVRAFSFARHPLDVGRLDFAVADAGDRGLWVVGGTSGGELTVACERIDPWLTEVEPGPDLPTGRRAPALLVASDGALLVAGGGGSGGAGVAVLSGPGSTWVEQVPAGSMLPALSHSASALTGPDEWVLAGGTGPDGAASDTVNRLSWDGAHVVVESEASLGVPRARPTATVLGDRVLVAGGTEQGPMAEWLDGAPVDGDVRARHAAVAVGSEILLVGGLGLTITAVDASGARSVGELSRQRLDATASALADGSVLVIGGTGHPQAPNTAEILIRAGAAWTVHGTLSLSVSRSSHRAVLLPDGGVLAIGGVDSSGGFVVHGDVYTAAR